MNQPCVSLLSSCEHDTQHLYSSHTENCKYSHLAYYIILITVVRKKGLCDATMGYFFPSIKKKKLHHLQMLERERPRWPPQISASLLS